MMKNIPPSLAHQYKALLKKKGIPDGSQRQYLKWLRYYLDFCHKYQFDDTVPRSLPHFIEKLKEKKQGAALQKQAHSAIRIYYENIQLPSQKSDLDTAMRSNYHEAVKEVQRPFEISTICHGKTKPDANASSSRHDKWKNAFNTLLFFFRHVLNKEFGKIDGGSRKTETLYPGGSFLK